MKTRAEKFPCAGHRARRQAGFTMAEIAISLGVIAFALIAIVGILPSGLNVQRDNREETIVNQDARLLLAAIRSGGRDTDPYLGTFVTITNDMFNVRFPVNGIPTATLIHFLSDPLISPMTPPARIVSATASAGGNPFSRRVAARTLVSATVEPALRSMPPLTITSVMPSAPSATMTVWTSTVLMLLTLMKALNPS